MSQSNIKKPSLPNENALSLDWALYYAQQGWPILPLHWPEDKRCSCGKDCEGVLWEKVLKS